MNTVFILLLSFVALSLTNGQNPTIGELRAFLEPLKHAVDLALASYKKHKYVTFQTAIQKLQLSDKAKNLPDNTTLTWETHSEFQELTRFRFIYPILADPVRFSEALKLNALELPFYHLSLKHEVNLNEPILVDLIDTILEISEAEKEADFNRTNLELDELYYGLQIKPSMMYNYLFLATSGYYQHFMETLLPFVTENDEVEEKVIQHANDFNEHLAKLPEVLPLNNRKRIQDAMILVHRFINLALSLENSLRDARIACGAGRCEFAERLANPPEPYVAVKDTLPDLINAVEPLQVQLEEAIPGYRETNYTVFARVASQFVFSEEMKLSLQRLPLNSTLVEAHETFLELTTYKFLYPILIDPVDLGDALKVNALTREVLKALDLNLNLNQLMNTPGMKQVQETISKIIQEEAKIGHSYNKTNMVLDELYDELGPPDLTTLKLTYEYVKQECQIMKDFCYTKAAPCERIQHNRFIHEVIVMEYTNEYLHREYPIDSDKQVKNISKLLKDIYENRKLIEEQKKKPFRNMNTFIDCDVLRCKREHNAKSNDKALIIDN